MGTKTFDTLSIDCTERDIFRVALRLLQDATCVTVEDLLRFGSSFPEMVLYGMTFGQDLMLQNPMSEFKARAEAGDFNPLLEYEDGYDLGSRREPMTDEEFAVAKVKVVKKSQLWNQKPEATIAELWQNAWCMARMGMRVDD